MASGSISINWPIPTNLVASTRDESNTRYATFSWDKLSNTELSNLDPSGGGYVDIYWRVSINGSTYLVYNNPTFTYQLSLGGCHQCVKVQSIYVLGSNTLVATSEFCEELCVESLPDLYCLNKKLNKINYGGLSQSGRMRWAQKVKNGSFR
tara:strand:- start:1206 stop:1658 length:453 start_codon:yes stop_codon:yes gene_type:complete